MLSFHILSRKRKVSLYKTKLLSLVLMGMKNNSRKTFWPKKEETSKYLGYYIQRNWAVGRGELTKSLGGVERMKY
jgi:hypothetical protein